MQNKRKVLLILMIMAIILTLMNPKSVEYLKAKAGYEKETLSVIKEIEKSRSSQIIYEKLDNGLIQYLEGILMYYNSEGEQLWSINLGINRPIIKTNTNSVYVINERANQIIRINKEGEQVYKITLDKPYMNGNICNDNYMIIYHKADGPIKYLTILNDEGKKVGEITLGEGEITNMTISKVQDRIAISTLGTNDAGLENNTLIYDLNGNLLGVEILENNIVFNLFYNEKGNLIVIDEKNLFSINKNKELNWKTSFNEPITLMDTANKDFITLYGEGNRKNSIIYSPSGNKLKTLSQEGKLIAETKIKEDILGLDSYKNNLLAYSLRTILIYDKEGNVRLEYPYSSDILKSFMLTDHHLVVITKEKNTFLKYN